MSTVDWVVATLGAIIVLAFWVTYVLDKNGTIRDQTKVIEAFADLNPELRKEFGVYQYLSSEERVGHIQLPRVLDYLEAKEATKASQDATSLVERVESRFNK